MASGDGNKETGDPPDFHGTPCFRWGSLLSAIRDQIPSMDSDVYLADSDEDGELFLFQRDQSNLIPDLTKELEDLPLKESYLQENFSFMRHPQNVWKEDLRSSAVLNEGIPPSKSRGDLFLDLGSQKEDEPSQDAISSLEFPINKDQFDKGVSRATTGKVWDLEKERDTPDSSPGTITAMETPPLFMSGGGEEERRKLIATKILSKAPLRPLSDPGYPKPQNKNNIGRMAEVKKKEAVISAEHPQEPTLFRFQEIEKWDLDNILQKLGKQDKATSWPEDIGSPSLSREHFRAVTESKLMAKLEELSRKQSKAFFPRWQRCPPNPRYHDKCQRDARDPSASAAIKNDLSRSPAAFCAPEPPTVYIDLRDTIAQKDEALTDETQSLSDSSSDDGEEIKGRTQNEEEGMMDEFSSASRYRKNCTGKCFLLQQLRNFRKRMSQSPAAEPNRRSQNLQKPDGSMKHSGQAFMMAEKMDSSIRSPLLIDRAKGAAQPSGEFHKETKEETCSELPPDASAKKDAKDSRIVEKEQEEHVKEEATKWWFQERLEKSKPQCSTRGNQPVAEQTPVLFHTEASYLAPVSTLPTYQSTEGNLLLLTVGLSSCGQVTLRRHPSPISSGATLAAAASIYPAIVTWLLSLVSCLTEGEDHRAPFRVLGLQQTWEEGALALRACIVPAVPSPTQSSSRLAKQNGTSLFYQQTSMFLLQTSLLDVLWWNEELCSHLQNQPYPFLPEIPDVHLSYSATVNSDSAVAEKTFAVPAGFYWQTVETDEKYFPNGSSIRESNDVGTEVAMTLLFETLLRNPVAVHHLLQLILASGLDVCGLRLLYPQQQMLLSSTMTLPSCYARGKASAMLALSLRGSNARSVLQDILGPSDPQLARVTDSCSISALYCSSRAEPLAYSPRTESRVHRELCFWFGGRAPCAKTLSRGDGNPARELHKPRTSFQKANGDEEKTGLQDAVAPRLPSTLVSTTKGDLILLASPAVPPHSYGLVMSTCTQRGFLLQGVKQLRLSPHQAHRLCMSARQASAFCPCKPSGIPESRGSEVHLLPQAYLHCLALLLRKENASLHAPALQKGLMNRITEKGFLEEIQSNLNSGVKPDPNQCFHVVPYTEGFLEELGGNFSAVPSPCDIPMHVIARRRYATDPDLEQVVLLSFTGKDALKSAGDFLHQILTSGFEQREARSLEEDLAFELLGLKWLPHLTRIQAKELSPFEVGDKSWQESLKLLMSRPALICALRRIGAFVGLSEVLKSTSSKPSGSNLQRLMSLTPEMAFRQAVLFFTKQELIGDFKRRPALRFLPPSAQYVPPTGAQIQGNWADALFRFMQAGAKILCTLLLIKPGMWSQNLARYLRKLDREKFSLVGMKHTNLRSEVVQTLMPSETEQSPADSEAHSSYLTSGSSLVLCLQRENAVKRLLDLLGPEDPKEAQAVNQFFWRALHGHSSVQNGFYGSASYCAAVRDIRLFFPEGLCGATYSDLEEKEVGPITADTAAPFFGIHKKHRLVKRENKQQFSFLGPKQTQTLGKPRLAGLYQATCLILLEATRQVSGQLPPYLALLEELMSLGFLLTGAQLTRMTESQASPVSKILSTTEKEESIMCSQLLKGPCLVLAAERDNAVVSFTTLLSCRSSQKQDGLDNIIPRLLYPKTEKQAEELLCRLFDFLTCESIYQIENQAT